LEKKRVEIKAPALERCRLIDTEAKRITTELLELEEPIDAQIKAEEQRKENEKLERERIERERVQALNARFDAIRAMPLQVMGKSSDFIRLKIEAAEEIDIASFPAELADAARYEKNVALSGLRSALEQKITDEAEAERVRKDREELDRLRSEQLEMQRKSDALAAAERSRLDKEAADKRAAELEEQRKADIAAKAEQEALAKTLADEAKRVAAERAKLEAEKKAAAKKARQQEIANATIYEAAGEAFELLKANGFADHIVTQKLEAALSRQQQKVA
jgi:hypothetical protein